MTDVNFPQDFYLDDVGVWRLKKEKLAELEKPKPMTNEEYLRSCTTEELTNWIAKQKCDGCNDEPYDDKHGTCKYCMSKKTEQVREWLKQPHTNE